LSSENTAPHYPQIAAKTALPQSVAQNHDRSVSRTVFFRKKRSSRGRANPEHWEKPAVGVGHLNALWFDFTS